VEIAISGPAEYDFCCFGVDAGDKLSDDRYMVFFNQTNSPGNEIIFSQAGKSAVYRVNLDRLPPSIAKLVFTVSIDGNGTMGAIGSCNLKLLQNNSAALQLDLTGKDFQNEKAIIAIEVYKKDVWRIAAVAGGFNGGLAELLKNYGGEEAAATPAQSPAPAAVSAPVPVSAPAPVSVPAPALAPSKISLEKKLSKAPALLSLAKPLTLTLEKHKLTGCIARVALTLDISGSMTANYQNGTVQKIVNKMLPIAVQFDDDGELDFWYYGTRPKRMKSVNLDNYQNAVPSGWRKLMSECGGSNNECAVMKEIIDEYKNTKIPAYVIFITDGGVGNASGIKKLLIEASKFSIFWQFVGVSGSGYGVLEQLDTMSGRYVDNANFFALDDFNKVADTELYDRLLAEFPQWLTEIKKKGMIS
jgi:stress response protein SCP2